VTAEPESRDEPERSEQRLQKILAAAGIASRRKAEELITAGRVQVNGQKVTELGSKADPDRDHIRVDGKLLKKPEQFRYFMLNKPKGVVTTVSDPEGRPTVMKFFARAGARVFPVGRLDYQSEGLLLMTNDGELANVLTSAASKVEKTYLVKVSGKPTEAELEQLRHGVMVERGRRGERQGRVMTQPAKISLVRDAENPWYEVVLTEGRNREIRKMFEEIGHFVEKIRRVGFGPLVLDVEPGEMRELSEEEVSRLKRAARRKSESNLEPKAAERRPRKGPAALPRPARKRGSTRGRARHSPGRS
jgi:23S rRNA pseudouridine2605 synthase